jgi:hypothetical protein
MKRGVQISRWLSQVKADRRFYMTSDFKVAIQLTERTNNAAFARSGILQTWQGVALIAAETGLDERTVQRAVRRLQAYGHVAVDFGGGRAKSNCCTLILKGEMQTPAPVPPFIDKKTPAQKSLNPGTEVPKPRHTCHPNLLKNYNRTSCAQTDTEPSGPRQRADGALGPRPPAMGELDAPLRARLAERFVWLAGVTLKARTTNAVTLSVLTPSARDNVRKYCEADILAATGAAKLEFEFAITPEIPKPRRMP